MMHPEREQWWILVNGRRHVLSVRLTALFRFIALLLPSSIAIVSSSVLCAAEQLNGGENGRRNYALSHVHLKGTQRNY